MSNFKCFDNYLIIFRLPTKLRRKYLWANLLCVLWNITATLPTTSTTMQSFISSKTTVSSWIIPSLIIVRYSLFWVLRVVFRVLSWFVDLGTVLSSMWRVVMHLNDNDITQKRTQKRVVYFDKELYCSFVRIPFYLTKIMWRYTYMNPIASILSLTNNHNDHQTTFL